MNTEEQNDLQNRTIDGITIKTAVVVIAGVISIVTSLVVGYNGIQDSLKDTRTEFRESMQQLKMDFRSQIDTVKYNQVKSHYENEMRFKDIENKIDRSR